MTQPRNPFEVELDKNDANYVPLSPLSFLRRTASVYPNRLSVIHGDLRRTWAESYERCVRLASAISATTLDESTPPERSAPSGTSAVIRLVTASRRWCSSSASRSRSEPRRRSANETCHHRCGLPGVAP